MKTNLNRLRSVDGETVFAAILLVIAVYMFVESYEFSSRAATFPRAISGAAIVGCVLLLVSGYLPQQLRGIIEEDARIVKHENEPEVADAADEAEDDELEPLNSAYTALLIAGYLVVSYLIGFFIATPLFVVAYVLVFDINRLYGAVVLVASVVIVYGFDRTLNAHLNEGVLLFVGA